jgi:uncharacterized sulfatase
LFLAASLASSRASAARPNLIYIMTDDQAQWALSCYGNTDCPTPNMDRIAREGALFKNGFVVTPVCSPSRASFFTGRYGTELNITDWINKPESDAGVGFPDNIPTWPRALQRAGYATGLIGKWHLGGLDRCHPTKHGFDYFMGFRGGGEVPMNPNLEVEGKVRNVKGPIPDILTDDALKFVERNKDKPFALCLFFREPHQPYEPMPEEDTKPFVNLDPKVPQLEFLDQKWTKGRHRAYYAAIHAVDRNLGRLLAKLDELKLADNTLIVFTSDHGYNIGHHGIYTKGNAAWIAAGVHGPKRPNMFEESIRVPLMMRWPAKIKPGTVIDDTVANIDSFATLCAMLDVPLPADLKQHGIDYSPALRGESYKKRDALFGQYNLHNSGLAFMRMIRTDDHKLVRHYLANGLNELYDLKTDPGETKNLYNIGTKKIQNELQARLTKWQESIDDPILNNPLNTISVGGGVRVSN